MKDFADKAVVMLFSMLLVLNAFTGSYMIIAVFMMITVASFTSFLRVLGKNGITANKIIVLLIGAGTLFMPDMIVFAPILAYEIFLDRHIYAGLVLFAGFVRFCISGGLPGDMKETEILSELNMVQTAHVYVCIYIFLLMLLAAYLSVRTGKLLVFETENKKIRDEGEINKETLKKQNRNLLDEQDKNIMAAQLTERNRIAREIHDNVGHMLSRSILQVGAMMVVHKDEKIAEELKSLRETLDTAMNNIRESVHDIRDEAINLKLAIEEIAEPLKKNYRVNLEFDADAEGVSKDIKYAAINIIKEAVSNIIKYSENDSVDIRFYEHPSMYQIIVHDYMDKSFSAEENEDIIKKKNDNKKRTMHKDSSGEGMGLENIKIRAEKLGGNATFTNENGFRVFVRIPKKE